MSKKSDGPPALKKLLNAPLKAGKNTGLQNRPKSGPGSITPGDLPDPKPARAAPKGLDAIALMAENALILAERIRTGQQLLKELGEQFRVITESDLPEAMDALGIEDFTLKNGRKITINQSYHPNISGDHEDEAFGWLRENGHDGIIKRNVSVEFGKGEDKIANYLLRNLRRYKSLSESSIKDKEGVHPQTLKAFVREMIESGENLPMEAFGVHIRRIANIK